jgi:4-alpha-glucanotransferase
MELRRRSGILIHITSLPSPFGIGDMGDGAFRFADFLHESGQGLWQVLPLNPTEADYGNSPYSGISAFALSPLLISPQLLVRGGLLKGEELEERPSFPGDWVDYEVVTAWKKGLLERAYETFREGGTDATSYRRFCAANRFWLDDYALFTALSERMKSRAWQTWPVPLRDRREPDLVKARVELSPVLEREKFFQHLCFHQWQSLREYCRQRGILLIGDIPLYVNGEGADVWAHPELFKLDRDGRPRSVAGVPPDYFSKTGQLWNNPVYDWERLRETGYSWWLRRIEHNIRLFDCIRIDHFRGLAGYWEVPAGAATAAEGRWMPGPGQALLQRIREEFPSLPFIAEDLGVITDDVVALRERFDLPGMRVFQFGFGRDSTGFHRPRSYGSQCVAYAGTHDNDTLIGWLYGREGKGTAGWTKRLRVRWYTGCLLGGRNTLRWAVIRSLYRSKAQWVVVPLQDVLGIGGEGRMNTPGTPEGNWKWRMERGDIYPAIAAKLKALSRLFGRS